MVPRSDLSPPRPVGPPLSGWPSFAGPTAPPRWPLAVALAVLLFLLFPLTGDEGVPLWSPAIGVGLALVAWFGRRFGLAALAGAAFLLVLRQLLRLGAPGAADRGMIWAGLEGGLGVA